MKRWSTREMLYMALSVALMAVCAWITVPLTVPFTMQTFAVFVTAGLLGKRRGIAAVLAYLLLGAVGVPVFSGFRGGLGVLFGSTGGYLLGFILTAAIVGAGAARADHKPLALCGWMALGTAAYYLTGTVWYAWLYMGGIQAGFIAALGICVVPFLIPDIIKIALASWLVLRLQGHITGF